MRVLLVEDDEMIGEFVSRGLREAGFAPDWARDGASGLELALGGQHAVLILDLMLPERDGLSLLDELRRRGRKTPVLILSARRDVADRVKGLETGGDDYLTKPFALSELIARVQALVRRSTGVAEPTTLAYADVTLDLLTREVRRGDKRLELRPREFALLAYLLRNPGRVVTKTLILAHVFDFGFDPRTNVVDVLVHRLREKLDKEFEPKLIQTLRGAGYALRLPG